MRQFFLVAIALFSLLQSPLSAEVRLLALAGSTRKESYNKKLILEAARIARELGATVTVIDLKEFPMPFYDGDLEERNGIPKNGQRLRSLFVQSDGIIIASPEYNASFSAVLKNSIDWLSRKETGGSPNPFKGKIFALMSASPGMGGGKRGLPQLTTVIEAVGGTVLTKQVTVPNAAKALATHPLYEIPGLKEEMQELIQACKNQRLESSSR